MKQTKCQKESKKESKEMERCVRLCVCEWDYNESWNICVDEGFVAFLWNGQECDDEKKSNFKCSLHNGSYSFDRKCERMCQKMCLYDVLKRNFFFVAFSIENKLTLLFTTIDFCIKYR